MKTNRLSPITILALAACSGEGAGELPSPVSEGSDEANVVAAQDAGTPTFRPSQDGSQELGMGGAALNIPADLAPDSTESGLEAPVESVPDAGIGGDSEEFCPPSVLDADGNSYQTVELGDTCWMARNLDVSQLSDGTPLPLVTKQSEWEGRSSPGYSYYRNDVSLGEAIGLGALYNWHAVNTGLLCPVGWTVPTGQDWLTLVDKYSLPELQHPDGFRDHEASNETGFSAVAGGIRYGDFSWGKDEDNFSGAGDMSYFWTVDDSDLKSEWADAANMGVEWLGVTAADKATGASVRCMKVEK